MRRMHIDDMQERIDRLENLVSSVVAQTQGQRHRDLMAHRKTFPGSKAVLSHCQPRKVEALLLSKYSRV
jgi:predicted TIM-barrel fold metal-dependent hydrolase